MPETPVPKPETLVDYPLRRWLLRTVVLAVCAAILWVSKGTSLYEDLELLSVGEIAPDFSMPRTDGRKLRLSQLRGYVVWLIFGRVDDPGTVRQLAEAREVSERFRDRNLVVLLAVFNQGADDVQRFVDEHGSPAAMLFDNGGVTASRYHARDWPTSYVIDKTGTIQGIQRGLWDGDDKRLNKLLASFADSGTRNTSAARPPENPAQPDAPSAPPDGSPAPSVEGAP